eukprot:4462504-Amphidinium_carterae.1
MTLSNIASRMKFGRGHLEGVRLYYGAGTLGGGLLKLARAPKVAFTLIIALRLWKHAGAECRNERHNLPVKRP